jgi:phage terminase large subunit-like protein
VCGSTPLTGTDYKHIALVAETAADARDVMIEGPAGLLSVHTKDFRPLFQPSVRRVTWPNGAIASLFNAVEPDQLRGPQHSLAWCDELAKWRYVVDTWDNLQFGMRLGAHPRQIITTTPRPLPIIKRLINDSSTVTTRGSTYDNRGNLPKSFFDNVASRYEGTRLGRQELNAEILDDMPGAMWRRDQIDACRIRADRLPALTRIVVAIDPSATSNEKSDETGIIVAGIDSGKHGYVLADSSGVMAPIEWAKEAVRLFHMNAGDLIVAEVNNGGEMVGATIRSVDPNVPYRAVHATRGKVVRAEPVSALYEQGRIHHVGSFALLEDQMCAFTTDFDRSQHGSPDRVDALVWAFTELMVNAQRAQFVFA